MTDKETKRVSKTPFLTGEQFTDLIKRAKAGLRKREEEMGGREQPGLTEEARRWRANF